MKPDACPETDPVMRGAWYSCLVYSASRPDVLEAYRRETGDNYSPPESPIEAAVDNATGRGKTFADSFVAWFNQNIWGVENGEQNKN